jgi:hypothetical protein
VKHPELVALSVGTTVAVVAAVICAIGAAVSLDAPPWIAWGLGLLLSLAVALRLGARLLDERAIRREVAQHAPEPPHRPAGPQL